MPITKINNKSLDAGSVDLASNVVTGLLPDASVSYLPSGTGAVASTVQSKLRESVSVKDFGADPSETAANNTSKINTAIVYASSVGAGVDLCGLSYSIQNITVKNGLRFLRNGKLVPSGRFGQAAIIFDGGTMGGVPVTECDITGIEMDCANNPAHCIYAEGCAYCVIENNKFYNLLGNASPVNHGIFLAEGAKYNRISGNTINSVKWSSNGVLIGLYSAGSDAYYGYFANATGNITAPANPCEHNIIYGNYLYGGQQSIWISGGSFNSVTGNNLVGSLDRGVILIGSTNNNITGNTVRDSKSSGIHMAYGCTQNEISGNKVLQLNSVGGEAGIQMYVGCGGNNIVGNSIYTASNYGIYCAVSSSYNHIVGNRLQGFGICGIAIQSDWWGSGGQGVYGRPNYGPPASGSRWAFTDSVGNSIKDNFIGDSGNIGADCGIALLQLKSADNVSQFKISGTSITGNHVYSTGLTHNLYVFEDVSAGVSACSLLSNSFADNTISKFNGNHPAYGPDAYSFAFNAISANDGINIIRTWTPVVSGSSTPGSATYSTQIGMWTRVDKDHVEIEISLSWSGHTGTGGLTINLPTASQYPASGGNVNTASFHMEGIPITNTKWPSALIGTNNDNITFYEYQGGGGPGLIPISASGTIYLTGKYRYRVLV